MSTLGFRKFFILVTVAFFLLADFSLTIFGISDSAHAAAEAQGINNNQNEQNNLETEDEEEDLPEESTGDEKIIDDFSAEISASAQAINQADLIFHDPPKLVMHPFDQAILELYIDPAAAERVAQPGTDQDVFNKIMEDVFGFNPTLDQFPDENRVRELLIDTFAEKQRAQNFVANFTIYEKQFATNANKAVAEAILNAVQPIQQAYQAENSQNLGKENPIVTTTADAVLKELGEVFKNVQEYSPVLVVLAAAIDKLPLDPRIAKTLIYLVTPRDQGGAGHERIKIERIWKDYADPEEDSEDNISRERVDAQNISLHRFGKAIDISEIDNVKCTLLKRGWVRKKIVKRPPIPVKVAFQSEDSLRNTVEGSSNLPLGFSMAEVFRDLALDNVLDGISDLDLEDLEEGSLKDATLNDILRAVGEQLVVRAIGLGGNNMKGYDFNDIASQVGRALIADKLGLPRYALKGEFDDIEANIGRADVEQRLNLPPESLKGENHDQILRSIGARKLERVMRLRRGSLGFQGRDSVSANEIAIAVGQGYIEETLEFKPGSFAGGSKRDIQERLGTFKFDITFQNPRAADTSLKVAAGTTARFLSTGDAAAFKTAVGERVLDDTFKIFGRYEENILSFAKQIEDAITNETGEKLKRALQTDTTGDTQVVDNEPVTPLDEIKRIIDQTLYSASLPGLRPLNRQPRQNITSQELIQAATDIKTQWEAIQNNETYRRRLRTDQTAQAIMDQIRLNYEAILDAGEGDIVRSVSRRDGAYNTPRGTIDRFLAGEPAALKEIGAWELTTHITNSTVERRTMYDWFRGRHDNLGSLEPQITSAMGMSIEDFQRVFSDASSDEVFKTIGQRRLVRAVLSLPEVKRFEQQYLDQLRQTNPELFALLNDVDFRIDRLRDVRRDLDRLERLVGGLMEASQTKDLLDRVLRDPKPANLRQAAIEVSRSWDRLNRNEKIQTNKEARTIMEGIRSNFRAVIDGEYPKSTSGLSKNDYKSRFPQKGPTITVDDVFDLLRGPDEGGKSPADVVLTVGLRQIEYGLGLPSESLFLFSKEKPQSPDALYRSVGRAKIQERYGRGDISNLINRFANSADRDLNLRNGTTDAFLGKSSQGDTISSNQQAMNDYREGYRDGSADLQKDTTQDLGESAFNQTLADDPFRGTWYQSGYADGRAGRPERPPQPGPDLQSPNRTQQARINENRFLEIVGRQTLIFSAVRRITGDIRIDGLAFTPEDIYLLLTGSGHQSFSRIAGYRLDQQLNLFPGTSAKLIGARNQQEYNDGMAVAGGALVGNYLGLGPIDFRGGNPILSTGAMIIENTLGLREGSVRKAESLQDVKDENPNFDKIFGSESEDILKRAEKLERIDRLLNIQSGETLERVSTANLVSGNITLEEYVREVGERNLRDRALNSDKFTGIILGAFGIEPGSELGLKLRSSVFGSDGVINIILRNGGRPISQWNTQDRFNIFGSLEGLFGFEFDRRAKLRSGTFAQIFANPDQARQVIMREGIFLMDREFDLDGKLLTAYNFFTLRKAQQEERRQLERDIIFDPQVNAAYGEGYNDGQTDAHEGRVDGPGKRSTPRFEPSRTSSPLAYTKGYDAGVSDTFGGAQAEPAQEQSAGNFFQRGRQELIERAEKETIAQIQRFVSQSTKGKVVLSPRDVLGIARGDLRVFQYIGFSLMVEGVFDKFGDVPEDYQLTIDDFKYAFQGADTDQFAIAKAGELAQTRAELEVEQLSDRFVQFALMAPDAPADEAAQAYIRIERAIAESETKTELDSFYKKNVQYKLFDIIAYKADSNIPAGFARAMLDGSDGQRFDTFLDYLENRINRSQFDFVIPEGTLSAARNYFADPNDFNYERLLQTGIFGSVEGYLNREKTLGFNLPRGTIEGLFLFGARGDASQIEAVGRGLLFQWADKSFKLPLGTSYQIYSLANEVIAARQALAVLNGAAPATLLIGSTAGTVASIGTATGIGAATIVSSVDGAANAVVGGLQGLPAGTNTVQATATVSTAGGQAVTNSLSNTQGLSLNFARNTGRQVTSGLSLRTPGTVTGDQFLKVGSDAGVRAARSQAQQRLDAAQAALVAFVVTTVFQKQLVAADQALGLVPGSMGIIIGQLIAFAFSAATPLSWAIAAGMFLLINIFGFTKIRLQCTADGYYPFRREQDIEDNPELKQLFDDLFLNLGEFNGMVTDQYRRGLLEGAQGRVQGLIEDLLNMAYHFDEDFKLVPQADEINQDMRLVQIITRRREDFDAFFGTDLYTDNFNDEPPSTGNRTGIFTGPDYLVDGHIHIGF